MRHAALVVSLLGVAVACGRSPEPPPQAAGSSAGIESTISSMADAFSRTTWSDRPKRRAGRLVVDTGLHALGWSREQAVDHLVEISPQSREAVAAEVDRYHHHARPGHRLHARAHRDSGGA